jgi:hypothetical protein
MPDDPVPIDRRAFSDARRSLAGTEARLAETSARIASARAALDRQRASGSDPARIATQETRVKDLLAVHTDLRDELDLRERALHDLAERLGVTTAPEQLVESLDGRVPVALLPVRLETRYSDDRRTLRIRVYPDQIHLDAHERELTPEEVAAGRSYWAAVFAATAAGDDEAAETAWAELAGDRRSTRARWVAEATRPDNTANAASGATPTFRDPPLKGGDWTRPVRATALPDRWLFVGQRGEREVFRVWGKPILDTVAASPTPDPEVDPDAPPEAPDTPGDDDETLLFDDPMRWVVDFGEAETLGMAVTVTEQTGGPSLRSGLDRLIVLGVDWTLTPTASATRLSDLLAAHRYSEGLALLPPGTPTNNTGDGVVGAPVEPAPGSPSLDGTVPPLPDDAAAPRLARALGTDAGLLADVPGSDLLEARTAQALTDVVWSGTLGHYLDELMEPLVDDDTIAFVRRFTVEHLFPQGPFATLQVGRQPYGILPVVANYVPGAEPTAKVAWLLGRLRPVWKKAATRVPRMGGTKAVDGDLLSLLQRTPLAERSRFRRVMGPTMLKALKGVKALEDVQAVSWNFMHDLLGWTTPPYLAQMLAEADDHPLPVPWVQPEPNAAPLEPNYLATIAAHLRAQGGRARLVALQDATNLLQAFAAHAAVEELDATITEVLHPHLEAVTRLPATKASRVLRTTESIGIVAEERPRRGEGDRDRILVSTPTQQAELVLPQMTGSASIADHILDQVAGRIPPFPPVRTLQQFVDSLDRLATRPALEIDRAFRGYLDATSHRLDAWYTALATERLAILRSDGRAGIHIGGVGWVEGLRPGRQPTSLGYVHAPSIPHAATAAILRSGNLNHRDPTHHTLDIQLTSERVQIAMPVLEGVAEGQSLAALLGYRFERSLRETDLRLARFILPIRRLAPVRSSGANPPDEPAETIAARDVVDGVRLLERWEKERSTLLNGLDPTGTEQDQLVAQLDALAHVYDAVADLLVSETVYQTVLGNYERAGAALAALDRQERPPTPEIVRTPRTGLAYTQRLAVAMSATTPPAPWDGAPTDTRARCAPHANAWMATLLPPPDTIRFAGTLIHDDGTEVAMTAGVDDLRLSPLSLVLAAQAGSGDQPSALEERVAAALTAGADLDEGARLEVADAPPDGDPTQVGLGALRALLGWIGEVITEGRPLTADDLAPVGEVEQPGIDTDHLAARSELVVAALDAAMDKLGEVLDEPSTGIPSLQAAIRLASDAGADDAVPRPLLGDSDTRRAALREQAETVDADLRRRRERVQVLDEQAASATDPTPIQIVAHHTARIRAVLGRGFPVLPVFRLAPPAERRTGLDASLADQDALADGDELAARAWVDRLAPVRPGVERLARALTGAEVLGATGGGADACQVAQLPHLPGQRWLALPFPDGGPSEASLALCLHAPGDLATGGVIAGVVCDDWLEAVPAEQETTGITFHFDAPGARAQQAVLLAVPPDRTQKQWTVDTLLATVEEAIALSRIRGVAPQDLQNVGQALPTTYLPHNFRQDRPSVNLFKMAEVALADVAFGAVLGKGGSM